MTRRFTPALHRKARRFIQRKHILIFVNPLSLLPVQLFPTVASPEQLVQPNGLRLPLCPLSALLLFEKLPK